MKKFILLTTILAAVACPSFAQKKEMKQAKTNLKNNSNLDQGIKLMDDCIANKEYTTVPEFYKMAGDLLLKIIAAENEKMYLKQNCDTAKYFTSIRRVFEYYEQCDSVERDSVYNSKQKFKYRKSHLSTLKFYRRNLFGGGAFFVKKNNYVEAYKAFDTYLQTVDLPMFADEKYGENDTLLTRAAYLATMSAHHNKEYKNVLKYYAYALHQEPFAQHVLEYAAGAYKELGDTVKWVAALEDGITRYPSHPYFFVNLADYCNVTGNDKIGLAYADRILAVNPNNTLAMYAKVLALMNMKLYTESIAVCRNILSIDAAYAEAHYNIALANCLMAADFEKVATVNVRLPKFKEDQAKLREYYASARPYMEKVRELLPEQKEKWAPFLYQIYLKLNLGKELEEIDQLIKN